MTQQTDTIEQQRHWAATRLMGWEHLEVGYAGVQEGDMEPHETPRQVELRPWLEAAGLQEAKEGKVIAYDWKKEVQADNE